MLDKIRSIRDKVEHLLRTDPASRDDDKRLILQVWYGVNPDLRAPTFTFNHFAHQYLDGSYPDPESIRRARQKLQEEYPELRGDMYYQRHNIGEQVRTGING